MTRTSVGTFSQVEATMRALTHGGVLLCTQGPDGRPNVMTIGWGTVGVVWGRPVFLVLVRPSRHTNGDVTVAVLPRERSEDLLFCGTRSGRDTDKVSACGLRLAGSEHVISPTLDDSVITYECQVIHQNDVLPVELAPEIPSEFYQSGDYHKVYFGHILAVNAVADANSRVAG
ncbi:MAG: flavin reductase [Armatimonadetes bacterium]|nr:flavin reductase [Armatimonadota bacterium]